MPRFPDSLLDEIRDRVPLSELIGRYVSWDRKSRKAAGDYWCACPFHGEKSASFHVLDKRGRYHCFGCGAGGDHFRFIMEMDGKTFPDAVAEVADLAGVSMPDRAPPTPEQKAEAARRHREREARQRDRERLEEEARRARIMSAGQVWNQSTALAGTLGERYLEWRCPGLAPPPTETELRFHPALDIMPDDPRGECCPAIVARVQNEVGRGTAIWRIYLRPDGTPLRDRTGKKMKMGLGPASGGAVRLGGFGPVIGLCEGIETACAIRRLGVTYPVWSALSTSGIMGFRIPDGVERVICYPDPDGSKWKTRERPDGTRFVGEPAGPKAVEAFRAANPDADIRLADTAHDADYLEMLQRLKGVEIR